jgi:hypothetical protein
MLERKVEERLANRAKERGGLALKFVSPSRAGVSDRIVLMPVPPEHREIVAKYFKLVETKAPGETPTPLQMHFIKQITSLGHCAVWVDSKEAVDALFP